MKRIRVVIADDHPLFLQGVRAALEAEDDVEVVAEANSGEKVLTVIGRTRPDFVLLDYSMPKFDGLACLDTIKSRYPEVKVAVVSGTQDPGVIEASLRRGACAFIVKSINPNDLAGVIRQVSDGTVFQTLEARPADASEGSDLADLTDRQLAILAALGRGLSNDAIAEELWITRDTVKFHVRNIYRKLGVGNRTEAARYAYQRGLVPNPVEELAGGT